MNDRELGHKSDRGRSHYFALAAGSRLFEFEIVSALGHGGFGITYLATDTFLQEPVALKEFFPSDLAVRVTDATVRAKSDEEQGDFETGLRAFLDEARLLARFHHRNIVHVRRFFELHGTGYIVQDYEAGQTLSKRLSDGPLGEAELRRVLGGVLDGLEAVHARAILHRDVKPDNIILREDGTPVLIDFGAARDFTGRHSRSITAIAAGGYTPPEQWGVGGQQGPWSDLYALGAIGYRCVTGTAPPVSLQRLRTDPLVPASVVAAGKYDPVLLSVIDWMLTLDEAKRPASVQAVRDALAGGSAVSRAEREPASGGLTITGTEDGHVLLAFEQEIRADLLDVAFFIEPPGRYLALLNDEQTSWSSEPSYFSLSRVQDSDVPAFGMGAEISDHVAAGSKVTVTSRDGFIRATATWPTFGNQAAADLGRTRETGAPRPVMEPDRPETALSRLRWRHGWAIAGVILLLIAALAGGGYWKVQQQKLRNQQLAEQLAAARFDRTALNGLMASCGSSCPADIRSEAQRRLNVIAEEERGYRAAKNDPAKLRAYAHSCEACIYKPEAEARASRLDEEHREADHQRLAQQLDDAKFDRAALNSFLAACGSSCPADLLSQAKRRLNVIATEEHTYQAAKDDATKLDRYARRCEACLYKSEAERRARDLAELHGRLVRELAAAGFDDTALNSFLTACGPSCPGDLHAEARRRLGVIAAEDNTYRTAKDDPRKLQAYLKSCKACRYESVAKEEISRLAALQKLAKQLADAGFDPIRLTQLRENCGASCSPDLLKEVQRRVNLIAAEERSYQAGVNNVDKLRVYLQSCRACAFVAEARQKIRAALEADLAAAGNNAAAIRAFLMACGRDCPADLRAEAEDEISAFTLTGKGSLPGSKIKVASIAPPTRLAAPRQTSMEPPSDLVEQIDVQLQKLGCDRGEFTSEWNARLRGALQKFNRYAHTDLRITGPTLATLNALKSMNGEICPIVCGPGTTLRKHHCVTITCKTGDARGQDGSCRPSREFQGKRVRTRPLTKIVPGSLEHLRLRSACRAGQVSACRTLCHAGSFFWRACRKVQKLSDLSGSGLQGGGRWGGHRGHHRRGCINAGRCF